MNSSQKERLLPQCPFWHDAVRKGSNHMLICESPIPNTTMGFTFRYKQDWIEHQKGFCCGEYKKCPMYNYLMETVYKEEA